MLLFIFVLTSVVRPAEFLPCDEPDTDFRVASECPRGQVLHENDCRSYFLLRSEGKACLLSEYIFYTPHVPTHEIICPLTEKTLECCLYVAYTADCLYFELPPEALASCNEFNADEEYERHNTCHKFTFSGFTYKTSFHSVKVLPAIVPSRRGGECPVGYCPTNRGKCIRSKIKVFSKPGAVRAQEIFVTVDRPTTFFHGQRGSETKAANFRDLFQNTQKVPGGLWRIL